MTASTTPDIDLWSADWHAWRAERIALATAAHGLAAAIGTHWLGDEPIHIDGLPGAWVAVDGRAVGADADGFRVELEPGRGHVLGALLLQPLIRAGELALRVFDPQAATRTGLAGIDAFAPDRAWVIEGVAEKISATLRLDHIDGFVSENAASRIHLTVGGRDIAFEGVRTPEGDTQITFADATNGTETQRFRFLTVPPPNHSGRVTVDFNRAYLPPCTFSDHYLCPLPPAPNRLDIPIRAGETRLRYSDSAPR
ncbi:hypothetical protein B7C42_07546 [Nocardia cerradoensis]|uniref:DUF1684 domain-containing protein n=1 Tax=Nocardia cerradoensis TaxID=85688 RepID=A0A231GUS0_9NOCA|nr:DUF1684 domain-containing protein [Nocardia cerradoensis]OXR40380.1 hypothetical protein B7C42_07546 [Nocardia cerradoensis]